MTCSASEAEATDIERLVYGPGNLPRYAVGPELLMSDAGLTPDGWQAAVLRSDARQMLLLCSRQSGKSTVAAALALKAAVTESPALVLLLSPTLRQSGELFRDKLMPLWRGIGRPVAATEETALTLKLKNGSRVVSLPGDEETIRGFSGVALLIIDEAARVPDELYKSVRPMLAVSGGRLVALSTPFGKRGWFYDEWHGPGGWERVEVPADRCPRIPAEFLAEERRSMGERWFAQEYLCSFEDSAGEPLFPPERLARAEEVAAKLLNVKRQAKAIGCDPGEGQASTAFAAVDEYGVIEVLSLKTPDTSTIRGTLAAFGRRHGAPPSCWLLDAGGGGKQIAHEMRAAGMPVRTVAFGESVTADARPGRTLPHQRAEHREERYAYVNRRAQMYGELAELMARPEGYGLPRECPELRRQLSPIPRLYDGEGRLRLPPKNRRNPNSSEVTLVDLIGHSPDECDAVVLSVHGMLHPAERGVAGAL